MMATNCFCSVRPPGLNKETSHGIFFSLAPSNTVCFATLLRSFAHPPLLSFVCWSQISWDVMSLRGFFSAHMLLNISCVELFILHELFFYLWFSRFLVDPKLKPHNLEVPCQGVLLFFFHCWRIQQGRVSWHRLRSTCCGLVDQLFTQLGLAVPPSRLCLDKVLFMAPSRFVIIHTQLSNASPNIDKSLLEQQLLLVLLKCLFGL